MTPIVALSPVTLMRDQVRSNALRSLEFMANTVLTLGLDESVCSYAQDALEDREDTTLRTKKVRALAIAVTAWLESRGVHVLSEISVPEHEILQWLCLTYNDSHEREEGSCLLEMQPDGVNVTWL